MGIGIVILIHLVVLFLLSALMAAISAIITYAVSNKEKRNRKLLLAAVLPFIGLYTIYFTALFGSVIVSETKKIDIGIGDAWYVPLSNNSQLLFIDLPEQAYIEGNGKTVVSDVIEIQQTEHLILGKTSNSNYFFITQQLIA